MNKYDFSGRNFDIFPGPLVKTMPKVLGIGWVPMSMAELFKRKLSDEDIWLDQGFYVGDLNAQRGEEVKLVLTSRADGSLTEMGMKYLDMINPVEERGFINGAVKLGIMGSYDRYESLDGEGVFTNNVEGLASVINEDLTKKEAKDSLFWKLALRHEDYVPKEFAIPGLHPEAINYIFSRAKEKYSYEKNMGVFQNPIKGNVSVMSAWCVNWLGRGSGAYGRIGLDDDDGRLVGMAPEAHLNYKNIQEARDNGMEREFGKEYLDAKYELDFALDCEDFKAAAYWKKVLEEMVKSE